MKNNFDDDEAKNNPDNWRLGLFYFNPKDKRLFVMKRHGGPGLTVNFANPSSMIVIAILFSLIVLAYKLST